MATAEVKVINIMDSVESERSFEQYRKEFVDEMLQDCLGENYTEKSELRRGQLNFLFNEATKAAKSTAIEQDIDLEDFKYGICADACNFVVNLRNSVREFDYWSVDDDDDDDFWKDSKIWEHEDRPVQLVKENKIPKLDRTEIELLVSDYIDTGFKCQALDRVLVDVVVAIELYAFSDEMINEETIGLYPNRSPLKQSNVIFSTLLTTVVCCLLLGGLLWLAMVFDQTWVHWTTGIIAVLIALTAGWDLVTLPLRWFHQRRAQKNVFELINGMNGVYAELNSDGAISADRILREVDRVAVLGVVWPSPLFVLLEDIKKRTGRF